MFVYHTFSQQSSDNTYALKGMLRLRPHLYQQLSSSSELCATTATLSPFNESRMVSLLQKALCRAGTPTALNHTPCKGRSWHWLLTSSSIKLWLFSAASGMLLTSSGDGLVGPQHSQHRTRPWRDRFKEEKTAFVTRDG